MPKFSTLQFFDQQYKSRLLELTKIVLDGENCKASSHQVSYVASRLLQHNSALYSYYLDGSLSYEKIHQALDWEFGKLRVLKRAVVHFLYAKLHCFGPDISSTSILVRAWSDHDLSLHEVDGAVVYVYPFPIRISRHLKLLLGLWNQGAKWRLAGYNFEILSLFKLLFSRSFRNRLEIELRALQKHKTMLACFGSIRTSDEWEAATHIFYGNSSNSVANKCHGVGIYTVESPNYTSCEVLTERQFSFFVNPWLNKGSKGLAVPSNSEIRVSRLLYVDQYFSGMENYYEGRLLEKVLQTCLRSGVPIKYHPNRPGAPTSAEIKPTDVLISVYSTLAYNLRSINRVIFVYDQVINPLTIFGRGLETISYDELVRILYR